jgi:hypothetical protein
MKQHDGEVLVDDAGGAKPIDQEGARRMGRDRSTAWLGALRLASSAATASHITPLNERDQILPEPIDVVLLDVAAPAVTMPEICARPIYHQAANSARSEHISVTRITGGPSRVT